MVDRLPVWLFLSIALLMIALAMMPLMRVAVGVDQEIGMQFFSVVMLLIGGLMSGLTAMILMVRRQPQLDWTEASASDDQAQAGITLQMHASGLLLFSGVPLLNFLVPYWLWIRHRRTSQTIDRAGQEVLNYQISLYLFLLLSLFMVFAGIGLLTTPLLLALHLIVTLVALAVVIQRKAFSYPVNIPIIQGRKKSA